MIAKTDVHIEDEEWYALGLSFFYFFCVLAAYYVLRPIREQLSAEVGSAQLPWFFGATFIATLILTPIFSWMVSRWPRHIVIPVVYLFFIACQFVFMTFFTNHDLLSLRALGMSFFVWVSVFNLFVVSVFWSFMSDIWSDEQARRLFPLIGIGGTLGAVLGPMITRSLVEVIGVEPLLLVSAGLLFLAVLCVLLLGKWARKYGVHRNEKGSESAVGGGMLDGLKQIFNNPFIRYMAILMLLGDAIGTIMYVIIVDYTGATFHDAISRTRFAADLDLYANVLQVIVQLGVTPWLLVHFGAGRVIAVWAIIEVMTCLSMAIVEDPYALVIATLSTVALVQIVTRSLYHSMAQPARETLFTLVPRELRYKGKNAVETVVWRAGDIISMLAINGLRGLGVGVPGFGVIGAGILAAAGVIGTYLANRVEKHQSL